MLDIAIKCTFAFDDDFEEKFFELTKVNPCLIFFIFGHRFIQHVQSVLINEKRNDVTFNCVHVESIEADLTVACI